jgi:hypothetical protein
MKDRITFRSALYCDDGPNAGMYRVDVSGSVYMTPEEYEH